MNALETPAATPARARAVSNWLMVRVGRTPEGDFDVAVWCVHCKMAVRIQAPANASEDAIVARATVLDHAPACVVPRRLALGRAARWN